MQLGRGRWEQEQIPDVDRLSDSMGLGEAGSSLLMGRGWPQSAVMSGTVKQARPAWKEMGRK